jgi:hypothetical protein
MKNKICFVLDTHYKNYTNRLKKTSLNDYIQNNLKDLGVGFLITTNRPQDFIGYENYGIMVYDINELRSENLISLEYEILPEDPTGIYPSKFPWNLERFGLRKAAQLGYNVVVNLDSDVLFNTPKDALTFVDFINSIYEENTIKTNQAIFKYEINSTNEIFHLHEHYKKFFDLKFDKDQYDSLDGPVIIYMGKTSDDILRFENIWNNLTEFGYKKEFGFGYEGIVCGNWSLCIPMSGFKLKWENIPLNPIHKYEDRY